MGLLFAILLLGVPVAAAIYDLSKTGDGVGNFRFGELIGTVAPLGALAKSVMPTPSPAPVKAAPPVVPSSTEPSAI